jgi:release factor glutamine methyltransferase
MGFSFSVNPDVLIPRPETEMLVIETMALIEEKKKNCSVLDLGCGSGVIGISLTLLCDNAKVTASDISLEAIEAAKQNAKALKIKHRMSFAQGDWFDPFNKLLGEKKFDFIVSNPPYIRSRVIPRLQIEVKDHEPLGALDGGDDGLEHYLKIIPESVLHLKRGGALILEIGSDQGESVRRIALESHKWNNIRIIKDLAGRDRVIVLKL